MVWVNDKICHTKYIQQRNIFKRNKENFSQIKKSLKSISHKNVVKYSFKMLAMNMKWNAKGNDFCQWHAFTPATLKWQKFGKMTGNTKLLSISSSDFPLLSKDFIPKGTGASVAKNFEQVTMSHLVDLYVVILEGLGALVDLALLWTHQVHVVSMHVYTHGCAQTCKGWGPTTPINFSAHTHNSHMYWWSTAPTHWSAWTVFLQFLLLTLPGCAESWHLHYEVHSVHINYVNWGQ